MQLIFASNNKGKISEIKHLLPEKYTLLSVQDINLIEEIPEPFFTFKENAYAKASYIYNKTGKSCFAEDSGIIAEALIDQPGVFSARFAGAHGNDTTNNNKLLTELSDTTNRDAYYLAVICLILNDNVYYFEGKCEGSIAFEPIGNNGFGYDPIFIPKGYTQTFGELPIDIKLSLSHRSKALNGMIDFLS